MTILQTQLHDAVVHLVVDSVSQLEAETDLHDWKEFEVIAVDTETTGLDYFDTVRLVQFGTRRKAWVFDPVKAPHLSNLLLEAMTQGGMWVMHNAPFDALHLAKLNDRFSVEELMQHVTDTQILAHLIDPRERIDGGIGHGLKELCAHYVDPDSPDGQTALKARFKELGLKHSEGFAKIPLNDETFVRYAGLDVILTARLLPQLLLHIKPTVSPLIDFEHQVQRITTAMTARGMRVDTNYALDCVMISSKNICKQVKTLFDMALQM